jgi:predicted Fe-Mo cluster-binding NifX family protein
MKIAVASTGNNLESAVSPIFGRSSAFIIVDLINGAIKDLSAIENPAKNETGSGNTAAQFIVDHEIEILISGKLGPVAFHILKNTGIKVFKITSGSVKKNLERFREGKLEEITSLSGGFPL